MSAETQAAETEVAPEVVPGATPEAAPNTIGDAAAAAVTQKVVGAPEAESATITQPDEGTVMPDSAALEAPAPNALADSGAASSFDLQRAGLPEDLRTLRWVQDSTSFEQVVRDAHEAQMAIGADKIRKPREGDVEDQNRYWNESGRPETADGYDLGEFKPPEDVGWSDDLQKSMTEFMHSQGLTQDQVAKVIPEFARQQAAIMGQNAEAVAVTREGTSAALHEEFGPAHDNLQFASANMLKNVLGDDFDALIHQRDITGDEFGNNPLFNTALMRIASRISPSHEILGAAGQRQVVAMSPDAAVAAREKILSDPVNRAAFMEGEGSHQLVSSVRKAIARTYDDQYGDEVYDNG